MKKIAYIMICLAFMMFFAVGAGAESNTLDGSDDVIEYTGAGPYPALDNINISPNVTLGYNIETDAFSLTSFNTKGTIVYGLASDTADIFFQDASDNDVTTAFSPSATDSLTAFPDTDWAVLGGSS